MESLVLKRSAPISDGMLYTLLSRATSRNKLKLLNFEERHIRVNMHAVCEMEHMRKDCVFTWKHPLTEFNVGKICLFNIVSWNLHIEHFLADKMYLTHSSVFCFTETHINNEHYKNIEDYQPGWKSIHRNTEPWLAICYDTSRVKIVKTFTTPDELYENQHNKGWGVIHNDDCVNEKQFSAFLMTYLSLSEFRHFISQNYQFSAACCHIIIFIFRHMPVDCSFFFFCFTSFFSIF